METCNDCQSASSREAKFCMNCGAALPVSENVDCLAEAKFFISEAADDIVTVGREVVGSASEIVENDLTKKMMAGAALGAVAVLPIPVVGWAAGAAVGAGIVAYRHFSKQPE
jgi:hypothetical protein